MHDVRMPTSAMSDSSARLGRSEAFQLARGSWLPSVVAQTRMQLPRTVEAARLARQTVRREAGGQLDRPEREIVEVLMTELVSNAVMHPGPEAGDSVDLHFAVAPDRIRVEVCDSGEGFAPGELEEPRTRPGGYGLLMVDRGSSRWGASRDDGNCVWFELDRTGR
jgi:anti-sigma regulatory factor (Ser/Thr protein kinase)